MSTFSAYGMWRASSTSISWRVPTGTSSIVIGVVPGEPDAVVVHLGTRRHRLDVDRALGRERCRCVDRMMKNVTPAATEIAITPAITQLQPAAPPPETLYCAGISSASNSRIWPVSDIGCSGGAPYGWSW